MELWAIGAFCATAGFCAKFSDEIAERQIPLPEALAAAVLWGLLAGAMAVGSPLSALFFAMAAGTALAGKLDHPLHIAALLTFAFVVAIFPLTSFNPWLFSLFLVAALADELEIKKGIFGMLSRERLFLPTAAAIGSLLSLDISYFIAVVSFDLFYRFADFVCIRIFPPVASLQPAVPSRPRVPKSKKRARRAK